MRVKIETPCFWGEGKERKGYGAGSVIEVPEDVVNQNPWMKPTDDAVKAVKYDPDAEPKPDKEK